MKKERVAYFDHLRVFATLAVVVLHTAAQLWYSADPKGLDWNITNFYGSLVRWGVPVFLMISGALFLPREIPTKTLYSKYIARMVSAFALWSVIYALGLPLVDKLLHPSYAYPFSSRLSAIIAGHYHMWFIPMIIGIYMCIPLLRQLLRSETVTRYFLVLTFVFAFAIPQLVDMANDFIGGKFANVVNMLYYSMDNLKLGMLSGFALYFILGYLLSQRELSKRQRRVIYALGVVGGLSTLVFSALASCRTGAACKAYYDELSVNVFVQAVAVFTWFRHRDFSGEKWNRVMEKLSKYSFGVYLCHVFVLDSLQKVGIHTGRFAMLLSIPVIAVVTVIISCFISWVLNQIPVVKKWMV